MWRDRAACCGGTWTVATPGERKAARLSWMLTAKGENCVPPLAIFPGTDHRHDRRRRGRDSRKGGPRSRGRALDSPAEHKKCGGGKDQQVDHNDERAETVTGFLERALAFFTEHGIVAKRLMTDNAFSYVRNRSLRELPARHGIRHLTTEPYRPRTNGKVERFHQTMAREWAYGLSYRSHRQRNQALPHWLEHYNARRPHSSLGDRPPISRVHNVRG
jgi:transposase InsO family protein